jgi:hypothetical protein
MGYDSKFVKGTVYGVLKLTPYALRRGYIQVYESRGVVTVLLMKHGIYHISTYDYGFRRRLGSDSVKTYTEAQRLFKEYVRMFHHIRR